MVIKSSQGFTFVEIMIVVAILGVLTAFAYPSYQRHVLNTKRADTRADLLQISSKLQRYKIANFSYLKGGTTPITLDDISQPAYLPQQGTALYTLALTKVKAGEWELTATPKDSGLMKGDGIIALNSKGQKCWQKGQVTCPLSDTSSWENK